MHRTVALDNGIISGCDMCGKCDINNFEMCAMPRYSNKPIINPNRRNGFFVFGCVCQGTGLMKKLLMDFDEVVGFREK